MGGVLTSGGSSPSAACFLFVSQDHEEICAVRSVLDRQSDAMHEFEAAQVETKQTHGPNTHGPNTHGPNTHGRNTRTEHTDERQTKHGRNTDETQTKHSESHEPDLFTSFGSTPGACRSPVTCPCEASPASPPTPISTTTLHPHPHHHHPPPPSHSSAICSRRTPMRRRRSSLRSGSQTVSPITASRNWTM